MIDKAAARKAAFAARKLAHAAGQDAAAQDRLAKWLSPHQGKPLSAYMAIRTEIDPLPVMAQMSAFGPVCIPVIEAKATPLKFARWTPETEMTDGPFGARIPAQIEWVTPEVLIVPLVAFDAEGNRLGYGGGFYDRTLEVLRAQRPTLAVGFAYDAQCADALPLEPTDQPLDAIVTETRTYTFPQPS